jgi:hypothetical protein
LLSMYVLHTLARGFNVFGTYGTFQPKHLRYNMAQNIAMVSVVCKCVANLKAEKLIGKANLCVLESVGED